MIVRDSDVGMQVFMMKRSLRSNFGGIWVFPGGTLEDQDQDIASSGTNSQISMLVRGFADGKRNSSSLVKTRNQRFI